MGTNYVPFDFALRMASATGKCKPAALSGAGSDDLPAISIDLHHRCMLRK
jgi:hypothetical protein